MLCVKEMTWLRSKGWDVQWHHSKRKGMVYFSVSWLLAVLEMCVERKTALRSVSVLSVGIHTGGKALGKEN